MKEIYKCEYCEKIFENKDDCFKHEMEEHEGTDKYYRIIYDILDELNSKYTMNKKINGRNIAIDTNLHECDGYEYIEVSVSFYLDDYLIAENGSEDNIIYDIKKRMEECFLDGVKNIEGTLRYEGWQGGDGIDDYIINGVYLKDFLLNKDGKKIKIEIMD